MKLSPRSLFIKIFLWFCLTGAVATTLVFAVAAMTGSQPFGRRYVAVTQDLYARTAVDLYITGGAPALRRYLDVLQRNAGMEGHLLDATGAAPAEVLGEAVPAQDVRVLRQTAHSGLSSSHIGRAFWTAASAVTEGTSGHRYIFLLSAPPLRGFLDGAFFNLVAPRLAGGLVLAALFCLLLARHITQPVRLLQSAATRMAAGDLSVRTLPALRGRTDELAAMAAAFDAMAGRIEALLRNQQQMLADISHELRSPLTRIGVSLELLRRGDSSVIEPMQADLDRLNAMIGQILELTRFELRNGSGPPAAADLVAVLEDVVAGANREGRRENKSVHLTAPRVCFVRGDPAALHSCVENIVRNALQYGPPESVIQVVLQPSSDGAALLRIEDSGPGVPADALQAIFQPFFRVPGAAGSHPQGSGLGLSISARVVARCGGRIEAVNRSPHGLSVQVWLPGAAGIVGSGL